jgi:hypothetical protein
MAAMQPRPLCRFASRSLGLPTGNAHRILLADRAARFEDLGEDYYLNTIDTNRKARSHIRQLQALGFTVTITPAA